MTTQPSRRKLAKLYSPQQAADILGVEVTTLANWRCSKRYRLPFVRIGRKIKYPEDGVLAFIEERTESCSSGKA
ncbi:MAG: helix-turn-helix domain-containing protein [Magnetococcales bacterium]|nr:helix-turn-helix domain-containing protein [Magnetococcales bacterium]